METGIEDFGWKTLDGDGIQRDGLEIPLGKGGWLDADGNGGVLTDEDLAELLSVQPRDLE